MGDDIAGTSLGSRLALLALHFPRLRMIWSRSLHATADIFRALKANQDEPDPVTAAAIGADVLDPNRILGCQAVLQTTQPNGRDPSCHAPFTRPVWKFDGRRQGDCMVKARCRELD